MREMLLTERANGKRNKAAEYMRGKARIAFVCLSYRVRVKLHYPLCSFLSYQPSKQHIIMACSKEKERG